MNFIFKYTTFQILLLGFETFAQTNLINNEGFEDLITQPTAQGQVSLAAGWITEDFVVSRAYLHSPDLWTPTFSPVGNGMLNPNVTSPPSAHSGSNMIGMQPYELIQQKLSSAGLVPGKFYTCSMYIWLAKDDPTWWLDNSLEIWFAADRIKYLSESFFHGNNNPQNICNFDYVTYASNLTTLSSLQLNLANFPFGQWHKVSFQIQVPLDATQSDYTWFGVDQIKPNYSAPTSNANAFACEGGYLFIDDISIEDVCSSYCPSSLASIAFTSNLPNAMAATCSPWFFTVQNAMLIQFNVFDRWGIKL